MLRIVLALGFLLGAQATAVTPVQKVISMLENMAAKSKVEKEEEVARFKEFEKFCRGAEAAKVRSVEENTAVIGKLEGEIDGLALEIDQLGADIAKSDADIGMLADKIKQLDSKMDGIEGEEQEATEERNEEHAIFTKKDNDYSDSVDALDRAVSTMDQVTLIQESPAERKAALVQIAQETVLKLPSKKARAMITSFLQKDPEVSLLQQPMGEAAAYESQSGGVKELFQGLEQKLSDERSDGQKGESNEKHTYDVMMMQLNSQLKESKYDREKKATAKAQAEQDLAAAEGEKAATQKALAEDQKYLAELKAECEAKRKAFEERQATRAGELEAIAKAVEILGGGAVSGAAAKHLPAMVQLKKRGFKSLLQLSRNNAEAPLKRKVAALLQEKAKAFGSLLLQRVATRAAQDPFGKVNKMIKDMIAKLVAEANEEAEHKGFCDAELSANKATRDEKSETIDSLNAEIEQLSATETKLAQDIAALSKTVSELSEALSEATSNRNAEKAKNTETIADAKAASEATSQATSVLREFYAKAASLVQKGQTTHKKGVQDDAPATFGNDAYTGAQDSASNIMNFLEVVQSDFTRLMEETTADEAQAADDYSTFSADTSEAVDANNAEIKSKTTKKVETGKALQTAKTDLGNTQAEMTAAMEYYEKLKPSCVDSGISYEERVARRKSEIESLREAVKILDGTDVAVF